MELNVGGIYRNRFGFPYDEYVKINQLGESIVYYTRLDLTRGGATLHLPNYYEQKTTLDHFKEKYVDIQTLRDDKINEILK